MNNLKKIIIASAVAVGITAASGTVLANRDGGDRMLERVSKKLDLDDNQQSALSTLATEIRETRELMRGTDGDIKTQMESLITAETLDQGAALSLIQSRTAALDAQAPELVAAAAAFLDGLSAEQKADISQFMEKRGKRGGRGHRH